MRTAGELLEIMGVAPTALAGRVALITGGAQGIGAAAARALSGRGAKIALVDVEDSAEVAENLRRHGGEVERFRCDVADPTALRAVLDDAAARLGPIDILVHGAVETRFGPVADLTVEQWDRAFAVNARAPFVALHALLPGMRSRGYGVICHLPVLESAPFGAALSASKTAMRAFAASVANEIGADSGVAVFSVLPGVVDTPGVRDRIVPALMGILQLTEPAVLAMLARNPGYEGLVPVDDFAAALVYLIVHAREYHGQVADPFEPLARFDLLPARGSRPATAAPVDWLRQFDEVYARNLELEQRIQIRTAELAAAHARSEALLRNILPAPIAERLKERSEIIADSFDDVSVMFADLVGFTALAATWTPTRVVALLDEVFSAFDRIASDLGLEKIKTIGDCYMLVGGLPEPRAGHLAAAARAALAFRAALHELAIRSGTALACRIGLHVGPVVAGVIGKRKFIYDLWGDTVNTASRMESHGVRGGIQCTDAVRTRLTGEFTFEDRGEIEVKGKGPMRTWLLVG